MRKTFKLERGKETKGNGGKKRGESKKPSQFSRNCKLLTQWNELVYDYCREFVSSGCLQLKHHYRVSLANDDLRDFIQSLENSLQSHTNVKG